MKTLKKRDCLDWLKLRGYVRELWQKSLGKIDLNQIWRALLRSLEEVESVTQILELFAGLLGRVEIFSGTPQQQQEGKQNITTNAGGFIELAIISFSFANFFFLHLGAITSWTLTQCYFLLILFFLPECLIYFPVRIIGLDYLFYTYECQIYIPVQSISSRSIQPTLPGFP